MSKFVQLVLGLPWRAKLDLVLPPGIHRPDRNRLIFQPCPGWRSIPSVPSFYHFTIWYTVFLEQLCFIFQVCLQMTTTLSKTQTPQFLAHRRHPNTYTGGPHAPHCPNLLVRGGLTFPGFEIRPGQVAWLLCTGVHLSKMEREHVHLVGVWLSTKIKPLAASNLTHLHFLFLCLVFLGMVRLSSKSSGQRTVSSFSLNVCWHAQRGNCFLFSFHSLIFWGSHSGSLSSQTLSNAFLSRWQLIFLPSGNHISLLLCKYFF